MDWPLTELAAIKEQAKVDFQAVMKALATQRDAMNGALHLQEEALGEHARRTEERLERLTEVVQKALEEQSKRLDEHEAML